jgi:hypothetical protein
MARAMQFVAAAQISMTWWAGSRSGLRPVAAEKIVSPS